VAELAGRVIGGLRRSPLPPGAMSGDEELIYRALCFVLREAARGSDPLKVMVPVSECLECTQLYDDVAHAVAGLLRVPEMGHVVELNSPTAPVLRALPKDYRGRVHMCTDVVPIFHILNHYLMTGALKGVDPVRAGLSETASRIGAPLGAVVAASPINWVHLDPLHLASRAYAMLEPGGWLVEVYPLRWSPSKPSPLEPLLAALGVGEVYDLGYVKGFLMSEGYRDVDHSEVGPLFILRARKP